MDMLPNERQLQSTITTIITYNALPRLLRQTINLILMIATIVKHYIHLGALELYQIPFRTI
jgi:hypothetical protein